MISFFHCGSGRRFYRFPSGKNLAHAREGGGLLYDGCIGNSLIKTFKTFWSWRRNSFTQFSNLVYLQTARRYFYKDDFTENWFLATLKFLSNWKPCFVLSHRSNIAQRHWNLLKLTAIFIASPVKKKNIISSSSYQWVDLLWICWQTESCGFNTKIFFVWWRYKPGFYFFSLHKIQMSK